MIFMLTFGSAAVPSRSTSYGKSAREFPNAGLIRGCCGWGQPRSTCRVWFSFMRSPHGGTLRSFVNAIQVAAGAQIKAAIGNSRCRIIKLRQVIGCNGREFLLINSKDCGHTFVVGRVNVVVGQ